MKQRPSTSKDVSDKPPTSPFMPGRWSPLPAGVLSKAPSFAACEGAYVHDVDTGTRSGGGISGDEGCIKMYKQTNGDDSGQMQTVHND